MFFAIGPLFAALIVIAIAEGRPGFRDLGSRIIRWRVAWYWYAVAIGFPLAVRFVTAMVNVGPGGAPAPEWSELAWSSFAMAFLVRLVNPMDTARSARSQGGAASRCRACRPAPRRSSQR